MRTKLATCCLLVISFSVLAGRGVAGDSTRLTESISGSALMVIRAALPKLEEKGLKLADYRVSVLDQGSSFIVSFADPNPPAGMRGNGGDVPALDVEISKDGLRVIRANYVR